MIYSNHSTKECQICDKNTRSVKDLQFVDVYCPTASCKLTLTELIVLSYFMYQDEFGDVPRNVDIVRSTGLEKQTVKRAIDSLQSQQLLDNDRHVTLRDGVLSVRSAYDPEAHYRHRYRYTRCYVRASKASLTWLQTAVLSIVINESYPSDGWSIALLAVRLNVERETISNALNKLQQLDYIRVTRYTTGISIQKLVTLDDVVIHFRVSPLAEKQETTPEIHEEPIEITIEPETLTIEVTKMSDIDGRDARDAAYYAAQDRQHQQNIEKRNAEKERKREYAIKKDLERMLNLDYDDDGIPTLAQLTGVKTVITSSVQPEDTKPNKTATVTPVTLPEIEIEPLPADILAELLGAA